MLHIDVAESLLYYDFFRFVFSCLCVVFQSYTDSVSRVFLGVKVISSFTID